MHDLKSKTIQIYRVTVRNMLLIMRKLTLSALVRRTGTGTSRRSVDWIAANLQIQIRNRRIDVSEFLHRLPYRKLTDLVAAGNLIENLIEYHLRNYECRRI
ncbi:hypothetical protein HanIR_Chr08g0369301 [Helianthus annuus]|nr:hypothetical protein HanIR_Chr08g0369301 [Helianthus annuus]